jgi:hypothetical protein
VEETALRADIFDEAVFSIVLYLKDACWAGFLNSNLGLEYQEYLKKEKAKARERRVGAFLRERRLKAMEEAKGVKVELKNMKAVTEHHKKLILESQECALELALEDLVTEAIDEHCKEEEAKEKAKEVSCPKRALSQPRSQASLCGSAAEHMCDLAGRRGGSGGLPPTAQSLARSSASESSLCDLTGRRGGSGGLVLSRAKRACATSPAAEEVRGVSPRSPMACPLPPQKRTFFSLASLAPHRLPAPAAGESLSLAPTRYARRPPFPLTPATAADGQVCRRGQHVRHVHEEPGELHHRRDH